MKRFTDPVSIIRERERTIRAKDAFGVQDIAEVFHVPVSGTAGTAASFAPTGELFFESLFVPQQSGIGALPPVFTYGFSIEEMGLDDGPPVISGLVGVAKVARWLRNADGYYKGAVCHIAVVNMDASSASGIRFRGQANLSFSGEAILSPHEVD